MSTFYVAKKEPQKARKVYQRIVQRKDRKNVQDHDIFAALHLIPPHEDPSSSKNPACLKCLQLLSQFLSSALLKGMRPAALRLNELLSHRSIANDIAARANLYELSIRCLKGSIGATTHDQADLLCLYADFLASNKKNNAIQIAALRKEAQNLYAQKAIEQTTAAYSTTEKSAPPSQQHRHRPRGPRQLHKRRHAPKDVTPPWLNLYVNNKKLGDALLYKKRSNQSSYHH